MREIVTSPRVHDRFGANGDPETPAAVSRQPSRRRSIRPDGMPITKCRHPRILLVQFTSFPRVFEWLMDVLTDSQFLFQIA